MKKVFTIIICLLPFLIQAQTPTANAGADQTIYLTVTNQVTLTGTATNRSTSTWREVSTDYMSGATITSPGSLTTNVTGLPQGVFYFELAVTSPTDIVAVDTVVVNVNYATAPGILLRSMAQSAYINTAFQDTVNSRIGDTTNTLDQEVYPIAFPDGLGNEVFFDRNRKPDEWIDSQHGKFYSRVEDGYDWNNDGYGRAEMSFGSGYTFDTTKTYCMEWKGYFPQAFPSDMTVNQTVGTFMQIHANSDAQHVFGTQVVNTGSGVNFVLDADGSLHTLYDADSFVNKCHTVRVTFKEGTPGAFYKVEVDGVQKYYNNTSIIGGLPRGQDYPKLATLYDYGNALVNPTNSTRHRTFSLATLNFSFYDVSTPIAPPSAYAGPDQTITLPTTSATLSGSGTPASGQTVTGYLWTKVSGSGTQTFSASTASSTIVSGMTAAGDYLYQLQVNQSDSQTSTDQVKITVKAVPAGISNTFQTRLKFKNNQ
jgi:hypothetical protein